MCAMDAVTPAVSPPHQPDAPARLAGRRILLVEDEVRLARLLAEALRRAGAEVELAHDGAVGLLKAAAGGHDVVVLDIQLPGRSGYEVLRALRDAGHVVPVLMLTARDGERDELDALRLGADDYVVKPFSTPVLVARLANLAERRPAAPLLTVGRLRLEPERHRVWVADHEVSLTPREYAVLAYLVARAHRTIAKQELLDEVWDEPYADPNLVEVCVAGLRRKLGPGVIDTVRYAGYRAAAGA
jgi:DNA-binding response OmpR family regulator